MRTLLDFPRVRIARKPAPLHRLDRLSDHLGIELFSLRDDLNGFAFGGNKNRKLEFLIADAKAKGCDMLIGIGAQQSNFCRLAAAAGAFYGFEVHLVLTGPAPVEHTGNLLLDDLLQATIHFWSETPTKQRAWEIEMEFLKNGRKPYRMPSGGSTAVGALGYVEAMQEIKAFEEQQQLKFSTIFHASGSGGTQAGLVAGQAYTGWDGLIQGISVGRKADELSKVVGIIANETLQLLDMPKIEGATTICVDDRFVGEGYGKKTTWGTEAIEIFAQKEAIFLDNVYSGKAAAGLLAAVREGRINRGETILFLHTGGNVQLFAR